MRKSNIAKNIIIGVILLFFSFYFFPWLFLNLAPGIAPRILKTGGEIFIRMIGIIFRIGIYLIPVGFILILLNFSSRASKERKEEEKSEEPFFPKKHAKNIAIVFWIIGGILLLFGMPIFIQSAVIEHCDELAGLGCLSGGIFVVVGGTLELIGFLIKK